MPQGRSLRRMKAVITSTIPKAMPLPRVSEISALRMISYRKHSAVLRYTARDISKDSGPTQIPDAETNPHFTITVQAQGTELYIFYTRNTQSYKVYYLKYGTDISNLPQLSDTSPGVLLPIESGTGTFGSAVVASAKPVSGMNCVSNLSQTIILRANDAQNYIIFYYAPLQYTVEYKVWQYGGGTLSQTIEVVNGTDLFSGSTATAKIGYRFDGWYTDEACTVPVGDNGTITDNKLVPATLKLDAMPKVNVFLC